MRIRFTFAWYVWWVGLHWDRHARALCIFVPLVGVRVYFCDPPLECWRIDRGGLYRRLDRLLVQRIGEGQWAVRVPNYGTIPGNGSRTEPFPTAGAAMKYADETFPLEWNLEAEEKDTKEKDV